jgi:hypothetical protein
VADEIRLRLAWETIEDEEQHVKRMERLACHPRMEELWKELFRRRRVMHRPTNEFFHPVRLNVADLLRSNRETFESAAEILRYIRREPAAAEKILAAAPLLPDPLAGSDLQEFGAGYLFDHLDSYTASVPEILTSTQTKDLRSRYLVVAEQLRNVGSELRRFGMNNLAADLEKITLRHERSTRDRFADPIVIKRLGKEPTNVRYCVLYFARLLDRLFHKKAMAHTVGMLVEVAIPGQRLTGKQIERILRSDKGSPKRLKRPILKRG